MILRGSVFILGLILMSTSLSADDLTGADKLICASSQATRCTMEGDCEIGPPWKWNIPDFIEVDLKKKEISTTVASGENRVTPMKNVERIDGVIYLQGIEGGRAFSFVIVEETGTLSVAVATEWMATSVFGACTPLGKE